MTLDTIIAESNNKVNAAPGKAPRRCPPRRADSPNGPPTRQRPRTMSPSGAPLPPATIPPSASGGAAKRWLAREDFEAARRRTAPALHRTPLLSFRALGERAGGRALLKCENLQKTGSFKVRGALNAVASLSDAQRARGVVTVSAGNHAQAVAWAARRFAARAVVVMPEGASRSKAAAAAGYGAEVAFHGSAADAFLEAERRAGSEGLVFLHPFDSERVIEGHGAVGLELDEDLAAAAAVVVPVGGGGQIAGIAGALAARGRIGGGTKRGIRVFGVEPEGAPSMRRSLNAGKPARLESVRTVADGLAPPMAGELCYRYVAAFAEDVVLVSDKEILSALRLLLARAKLVAEPSGAAAVAALMFGKIPLAPGETAVAVVSGGNIDPEALVEALGKGSS